MFVPRYTEQEARDAVATSFSYAEALRKLGLRPVGGNHAYFRRLVDVIWRIPTDHFDQNHAIRVSARRKRPKPLEEVLVEGSTYSRTKLKDRLYEEGVKARRCELCGQDETWHGRRMSLILDHINGIPDDNRIRNLRIVCANCAATLDTHCGRKNRVSAEPRPCERCGVAFTPRRGNQKYCSRVCGVRHDNRLRDPKVASRKVPRPSYEQLTLDLQTMSFLAIGRKYGVSDNAVRKWIRWYEAAERGKEAA